MAKYNPNICYIDTLFGLWLCTLEQLENWRDTAWVVVEKNEIKTYQERSQENSDRIAQQPYIVDNNGIARITMAGPLTKHPTSFQSLFGGTSMMQMREVFRKARSDSEVEGIYLDADSPGGTANGTPEMAEAIRKFAAVKPIACHAEDVACSGMLWLATQCPVFTCGPMASVGSMGTILRMMDISKSHEGRPEKPIIITTGEYKAIGAPGHPITEKQMKEMERHVREVQTPFREQVAKARNLNKEQLADINTARVYVGQGAVDIGLVDRVCSADQAYDALVERVRSGSVGRSPAPATVSSAATRSRIMLSPEQLEQAKKLPGASTITTENADVVLLSAALALQTANNDLQTGNNNLKNELTSVKAQLPKAIDPQTLRDRMLVAHERIDLLVEKQVVLPAQAAEIKKLFMVGDQPNAAMLTPTSDGSMPYKPLLEALSQNKPNGVTTQQTGAQPAPRSTPGDPNQPPQPITKDRKDQLLGYVGATTSTGENRNGN